ncbi:hypothetical protein T492DRAFT_879546 [Pavlovales sp. CCMP2436]|nr:hypothetical protein T492DRAFT_879546 [Pavlovales sp. CCMP2436]
MAAVAAATAAAAARVATAAAASVGSGSGSGSGGYELRDGRRVLDPLLVTIANGSGIDPSRMLVITGVGTGSKVISAITRKKAESILKATSTLHNKPAPWTDLPSRKAESRQNTLKAIRAADGNCSGDYVPPDHATVIGEAAPSLLASAAAISSSAGGVLTETLWGPPAKNLIFTRLTNSSNGTIAYTLHNSRI